MPTTSDRGLFVWHELNTTDIPAASAFYTQLIGWTTKDWEPNPAYKLWTMARETKGGLYLLHDQPNTVTPPPHWLSYIGTPDVDATVRQAVEIGGKVVTPAYDVVNVGRMAVLQDPQGAMFGISQQIEHTKYTDPQLGDFSWHELLTTNWQTAFDFYSKLFGWEKMQTMDMGPQGTYLIYGTGGHPLGGMFIPGGLPGGPLWIPYILVRDARRTAETARQLGATIAHDPVEVPGGDWVFTGIDRQNVMFAVHSKARIAKAAGNAREPGRTTAKSPKAARVRKSGSRRTAKSAGSRPRARGRTRATARKSSSKKKR